MEVQRKGRKILILSDRREHLKLKINIDELENYTSGFYLGSK